MQNHLQYASLCAPKKITLQITKLIKLLVTIGVLSAPYSAVFAGCAPDGSITGANGQIILGSVGCADAAGNQNAVIAQSAIVFDAAGPALIAPIAAGHNPWQIVNLGFISSTNGIGLQIQDAGDNTENTVKGTIHSDNNAAVQIESANATITNAGMITSNNSIAINIMSGGSGTVINNQVGGMISSGTGVLHSGSNTIFVAPGITNTIINNAGTIQANNDSAVLMDGGTVNNAATGVISGDFVGLNFSQFHTGSSATVNNYGIIRSTDNNFDDAIFLGVGGTVNNYAGASITADGVGIESVTNPSTVFNAGSIVVTSGTGVGLDAGGTVTNAVTGIINGGSRGISVDNGEGIINNYGLITTQVRAVAFGFGPSGIGFGILNNYQTGVIQGGNQGSRAVSFGRPGGVPGLAVVNNAGLIDGTNLSTTTGIGVVVMQFSGTINNMDTGTIRGVIGDNITIHNIPSILMLGNTNTVTNTGNLVGDVDFTSFGDKFTMSNNTSHMTGQLLMGTGGNETATFQNVTDANIGTISVFNGGGGGNDQLNFIGSSHTGGNDLINWETINLNNSSALTLDSNLTLGGVSADPTATLNINNSTLNANLVFNSIIQANAARPVLVNNNFGNINLTSFAGNNSLIIRGNYVAQLGKMNLGAVLFTDGSPADKLVIDGQNGAANASGLTTITAKNLGGVGALTNGNGILVVQAINGATTNPGAFALTPIRGGIYDYRIFRGGINPNDPATAQDWFLRSSFGDGQPIWGPELSVYGAALPTAMDIGRVTLGTLQEREGDEQSLASNSCLLDQHFASGGWVRVFDQPYNEDYSSVVDPSASGNVSGVQAGVDLYRDKNNNGTTNLLGIYAAYAQDNPSIDGVVTNPAATGYINQHTGSVNLDARTGGLYWTHFWCNGSYVDVVAQGSNYIGNANTDRTSLSLHGEGTTESAELGYPITFARQWQLEPQGQIMYQYANFKDASDAFSTVDLRSSNEWLGRLGARIKYNAEFNHCLVQPYVRANFWSVLSGNNNSAQYAGFDSITTTAKANWAQLGGGVTVNFTHNFGVYGFADDLVSLGGNNKLTGMDAGLGVRAFW